MPETLKDAPPVLRSAEVPAVIGAGEYPAARTTTQAFRLSSWIRLLRPQQWLKNFFILAPLLFSGRALEWEAQSRALSAFLAFCLLASGVYILNDIMDREGDRAHPIKRLRPIASGAIGTQAAWAVSVALLGMSLTAAMLVSPTVGFIGAAYLATNVFYTFVLKRIVIVDVFAIASFFVMRLLAGAAAVSVIPSVWLLLCGGLLALFLGFAKRRHELVLLGNDSADHRAVLTHYSMPFLDQLSVVLLAVTVVSYIMYTLESETARLIGTEALSYSTVFVLYGVLRYLFLVHKREGGNPAETLLTDRSLLTAVLLWGVYCGAVIYRPF